MLTKEEFVLEQYKLYSQLKEQFTSRNFKTNRFYLISFVALVLLTIYTGSIVFMKLIPGSLLFSAVGALVCVLWWMNIDTYNLMIKIKYQKVLEDMENYLPVKPYTQEREALSEYKKKRKAFLFSDMQKTLAILGLIFFFALFVCDAVPLVYKLCFMGG